VVPAALVGAAAAVAVLVVVVLVVAGPVVGVGLLTPPPAPIGFGGGPALALVGSGLELERIATGAAPFRPGITYIAGWALVAPPTGIIDTARWVPGESPTRLTAATGPAALAGWTTSWTIPPIVPFWLGRTGWYWPLGHQAQASPAR